MEKEESIMFKKISLFLVLVLVIGAYLFYTFAAPLVPTELTDARKAKIEQASTREWYWDENNGAFCYGKCNGYDILFYQAPVTAAVESEVTIAGQVFRSGYPFQLLAYKGGILYDLAFLYGTGDVSLRAIMEAAKIQQERFSYVYENK